MNKLQDLSNLLKPKSKWNIFKDYFIDIISEKDVQKHLVILFLIIMSVDISIFYYFKGTLNLKIVLLILLFNLLWVFSCLIITICFGIFMKWRRYKKILKHKELLKDPKVIKGIQDIMKEKKGYIRDEHLTDDNEYIERYYLSFVGEYLKQKTNKTK